MLLFHEGESFGRVPGAGGPANLSLAQETYDEVSHQPSICCATFQQALDRRQPRKTPERHASSQPATITLKMAEVGVPVVDFTFLP